MKIGRPAEAVQQADLGLQEDPLNLLLRINRASYLAAAGRDEDAAEEYHEILELNPSMVLAQFNLAGGHASLGEWDQALPLCEEAYALAPLAPSDWIARRVAEAHWGYTAGGRTAPKLQPADAFGVPLGLAIYHWALQEFDAEADWMEKAIDQRDPSVPHCCGLWFGAELRSTPRWAGLMRKLNLPES